MRNITASEIIGLPVFAIREGKYINTVRDVIYHPTQNKVGALLINANGWFAEPYLIAFREVRKVGEDAVLIETEDALMRPSDVEDEASIVSGEDSYLSGVKIITEEGVVLGKVTDIFFNSSTGRVEEFEVTSPDERAAQFTERIRIKDIVSVGRDAAIVRVPPQKPYDVANSPDYPFP